MQGLSFDYPTWYLLLCPALGLAYAWVLYYKQRHFGDQSSWLNWVLGGLRFVLISTLAILLLGLILRSIQTETKRPIVVLAQDVSESVAAEMNTADSTAYTAALVNLQASLAEDYELHSYAFGEQVRETSDFAYTDKISNLTAVLQEIDNLYTNQNLGAVILATDGIYNEGSNPVYANVQINAPVYTVALGDTTIQRDVVLKRVFHNKIAYLGDKFTIQLDVAALNAAGTNSQISVSKIENGQARSLQQIPLNIDRDDFFRTEEIILDANTPGVQRFRISVRPINGEENRQNNVRDIFVDVLDARQKILILAANPHPDLGAIRQSLQTARNNEVTVAYAKDFNGQVSAYDLVILHNLPNRRQTNRSVLNALQQNKVAHLFICGPQTDFNSLNQLQNLLEVRANGQNINEVQARLAPEFGLFNLDDELRKAVTSYPPLTVPFGEFNSGSGQALLFQQIGNVETRFPLLVLGENDGVRKGVLAGEGLWKWRLFEYLEKKNHQRFDDFLGKIIQYVSLKEDKRRFRVSPAKNIFDENESVTLDAELYNDSYELINEPDASVVITDEEGKEYNYTFNRVGRAYTLNAGILPVGNYQFRAATQAAGQNLSYSGQFSIQPIQRERYATTADHNLLRLLSERFGGESLTTTDIASIPQRLIDQGTVKPVMYQTQVTRSVINLKWIFFLLLTLLTIEWFLRRYYGAY